MIKPSIQRTPRDEPRRSRTPAKPSRGKPSRRRSRTGRSGRRSKKQGTGGEQRKLKAGGQVPDGWRLVESRSSPGTLSFENVANGQRVTALPVHDPSGFLMAEWQLVASRSRRGETSYLHVPTGKLFQILPVAPSGWSLVPSTNEFIYVNQSTGDRVLDFPPVGWRRVYQNTNSKQIVNSLNEAVLLPASPEGRRQAAPWAAGSAPPPGDGLCQIAPWAQSAPGRRQAAPWAAGSAPPPEGSAVPAVPGSARQPSNNDLCQIASWPAREVPESGVCKAQQWNNPESGVCKAQQWEK